MSNLIEKRGRITVTHRNTAKQLRLCRSVLSHFGITDEGHTKEQKKPFYHPICRGGAQRKKRRPWLVTSISLVLPLIKKSVRVLLSLL